MIVRKPFLPLLLLMLVAGLQSAFGQSSEPVSTGRFNNVAIGAHDTSGYHLQNSASKGIKQFVHIWKGAQWRFGSQQQLDLFAADPEKYAPAYNGFCSNALSIGQGLVRTNGKVWHIWGSRLHLFYAEAGRQRWLDGDYQEYNAQAAEAWQEELAER